MWGASLALAMIWWVLLAGLMVYGIGFILASIRFVPTDRVGIVTHSSGQNHTLGQGLHLVFPFGYKVSYVPKGPQPMDGEVRDVITRDGWRLTVHVQLNGRLVNEAAAVNAGGDWRKTTLDAALRVLRTELENNDATDLRPRPQALDASVTEELNLLCSRWGTHVDWLRVTIRWAFSIPPVHEVPRPF